MKGTDDTKTPDVKRIAPTVFEDERGFFFESFNHKRLEEAMERTVTLAQDNHSKSIKGVFCGLHDQPPPHAQGKRVRIVQGDVFDVAVDIRKSSPTFGQWSFFTRLQPMIQCIAKSRPFGSMKHSTSNGHLIYAL